MIDPATWLGVGVPGLGLNVTIAADHLVDIDLDILIENRPDTIFTKASGILDVDDGLIIHIAKGLVNDGQFITGENTRLEFVNSGAILRNNGLFKDGLHELPGNVNFLSKASITGSSAITFNNLTINSDTVSLPLSMQQVPSIKGTLTINGGIFRTAANAVGPIYLSGSNLIYKTGTIYQRGVEWNCTHIAIAGTTAGYPHNVVIDNNTTLNLRNNLLPAPLPSVGSPILPVFGNLSIYRGGLVNNLAAPYGPVQINGNLQQGSDPDLTANITFGSNSNARIIIEGDFERKFISNSNIPYTNPFRFIGPGNSHLTLAGSMGFRRLEINKLNGAEVILGSEVKITEALILTEGTIKTNAIGSKFLFLDSLASITGGNSTSFVDGPLHKITTPTGDGSIPGF